VALTKEKKNKLPEIVALFQEGKIRPKTESPKSGKPICLKCDTELEKNALFCIECGSQISSTATKYRRRI